MEHNQKEESEISRLFLGIMEGYSDSVIPSFSQLSLPLHESTDAPIDIQGSTSRKRGKSTVLHENEAAIGPKVSSSRKRGRPKMSKKEIDENLLKERGRRQKMNDNYDVLHSLVPKLLPKATREKIVGGTIAYIRSLKKEKKRLEDLKNSWERKMSLRTNWNSSINVTISSKVAFFGIQSMARQGLVAEIFGVFQKHRAEILEANVAVNDGQLTVTAIVNDSGGNITEKIKRDILSLQDRK